MLTQGAAEVMQAAARVVRPKREALRGLDLELTRAGSAETVAAQVRAGALAAQQIAESKRAAAEQAWEDALRKAESARAAADQLAGACDSWLTGKGLLMRECAQFEALQEKARRAEAVVTSTHAQLEGAVSTLQEAARRFEAAEAEMGHAQTEIAEARTAITTATQATSAAWGRALRAGGAVLTFGFGWAFVRLSARLALLGGLLPALRWSRRRAPPQSGEPSRPEPSSAAPSNAETLTITLSPGETLLLSPRIAGAEGQNPALPAPFTLLWSRWRHQLLRLERVEGGAQGRPLSLHGPHGSTGRWFVLDLGAGEQAVVPLLRVVGWSSTVRLRSSLALAPLTLPLLAVLRLPVFVGPGKVLLYARASLLRSTSTTPGEPLDAAADPFFLSRLAVWGQDVTLHASLLGADTVRGGLFRLLFSPVRLHAEGAGTLVLESTAERAGGGRGNVQWVMDVIPRIGG